MRYFGRLLHNRRGQALPGFVIGMFAFLGLSAGAVDISRHAFTATELQNLADAAASAAAKAAGNNGSAYSAAQSLSNVNTVNGQHIALSSGDVLVGHYNGGNFTAGGTPANAVRVTARTTLNNIMSGFLGYPTSTISRTATATIVSLGGGIPTMPIAIGESYWMNCITYGCEQPQIVRVPDPADNAGWTGFYESASQSTVADYIPSSFGCWGNNAGGGEQAPYITVGSIITVGNGQGSAMDRVQCYVCLHPAQNNFLVPVVKDNGPFNQSAEVVGFATIVVDSFEYSGGSGATTRTCSNFWQGGGSLQRVNVRTVINANTPGPPGPGYYGSGYAQVVG